MVEKSGLFHLFRIESHVESGTPQGGVISPLIFTMIHEILTIAPADIGRSLFAGCYGGKGRNVERAVRKAERESTGWWRGGVTQVLVLFHQKKYEGAKLRMYGKELEREATVTFLVFRSQLTFIHQSTVHSNRT